MENKIDKKIKTYEEKINRKSNKIEKITKNVITALFLIGLILGLLIGYILGNIYPL